MAKKKYVAQIKPTITKEDEASLNRQFKDISGKFKLSMGTALKVGAVAGATGVLLGWWNSQKKAIDNVNVSFDNYLANTDRIGTIANDLQASNSSFALTDTALGIYGLSSEDKDKLYNSVKSAVAEGKIVNKGEGNTLGALQSIQEEYRKALQSGNIKRQNSLKEIAGLRGQKATEFLSGNLNDDISKLELRFSRKEVENAVKKGGELEQKQAENLAIRNLEEMLAISKVANESIIKSQEEANKSVRNATLMSYGSYDVMVKEQIAKEKLQRNIYAVISSWLNPIIGDLSTINPSNAGNKIAKIIMDLFNKIWTLGFDSIKSGLRNLLASSGLGKFLTPEKKEKKTETEKQGVISQGIDIFLNGTRNK
jgi:hypothetical protein